MISTPKLEILPLLPELILLGFGLVLLVAGAAAKRADQAALALLSLAGLAAAAAAAIVLWSWDGSPTVLGGMIETDRFSVIGRLLVLGSGALGVVLAYHYFSRGGQARSELYPLLLFAVLGMTLITAAADLILVFLALEVLSLALYVLTAFGPQIGSTEAATKYFLLGAFSSAFFLYGVAMAYGAAGTTHIAGIVGALSGRTGSQGLALLAVGLLLIGFGFKIALVPFHMWTPDVYQGAPTAVTGFMAAGTKVAAFMAMIRVLAVSFQPLTWDWRPLVWLLSAITMVVGSVLAIAQRDLKRLLAYSSIAQAGFILTALTLPDQRGIAAAIYYLIAYAIMVLGAFGVVMLASGNARERTSFDDLQGLARRSPALAGLLTLFLVSLAGIPPTAGFVAKVGVFGAAVRAGYWPLALIGVLASVVAAFYYLRVVVLVYMVDPEREDVADRTRWPLAVLAVPAALTLVLGVFPGLLFGFLEKAAILRW